MIPAQIDLSQFFTAAQWSILLSTAAIAQSRGWQAYVVGGIVRDCILKTLPNSVLWQLAVKNSPDVDVVIDGDTGSGIEVAIALHAQYPNAKLQIHPKFQTAEVHWANFSLDIATARTEIYEYPGANPRVQASTIQQDLYRRDFTINALAVEIRSGNTDLALPVVDLYGGLADLAACQIRAIRFGSFAEDPRRIYRAVRFAVRFNFELVPAIIAEIVSVTASGLHDLIGGSRLKAELNYILVAPQAARMLQITDDLGGLRCVHPQLHLPKDFSQQFRRLKHWRQKFASQVTLSQIGLELLLSYLSLSEVTTINLNLLPEQLTRQQKLTDLLTLLPELSPKIMLPSQIVMVLQKYDAITLVLAAVQTSKPQRRLLWQYFTHWQPTKSLLSGDELKQMGCGQGRAIGSLLNRLRAASLDGEITAKAEAISLAQYLITQLPE